MAIFEIKNKKGELIWNAVTTGREGKKGIILNTPLMPKIMIKKIIIKKN